MRRIALLLFLILFPVTAASAQNSVVLTEPSHRNSSGVFVDDDLALLLSQNGRLGIALFQDARRANSLYIDMALIEEVQDLTDGYTFLNANGEEVTVAANPIAMAWLTYLERISTNKTVFALPYGNPERAFLMKRAPSEYRFYQEIAEARLSGFLGVPVERADSRSENNVRSSDDARTLHTAYRNELRRIYAVVPAPEVASLRLQLGKIMNPTISKERLPALTKSLRAALKENRTKLRVASGNYTITASKYNLPLTVINGYSLPVTVKLQARASNSRVLITKVSSLTIPANSQLQVELPLEVIASGETDLSIKLLGVSNKQIGEVATIPLRLAVISPVTTWFTTGMAIILLLAAIIQSLRRVKKRKVV